MIPLADLLTDPRLVEELPPSSIPALMVQLAAIQSALAARLAGAECIVAANTSGATTSKGDRGGDGWLTVEKAAEISNLGTRWLYRHWQTVPGAKKFSRRRLRFREGPLRRWLQKGA